VLVRVLGPLRVEGDDGCAIPVTRPIERRVLTALAALRPRVVPTDALIDAAWGEHPPPSARKTLQTNVFRLRERLGTATVIGEAGGYRLADAVLVDVDELEAAAEGASSVASWDDALRWCQGTPFEELLSWQPIEARRARLEELHRSACEARIEAALDSGPAAAVISDLEELVVAEPFRERRWCLLVRALVGADRRAEALRAAERARRLLAEELDAPPGPELSGLYESLLTGADPHARPTGDVLVRADRSHDTGDAAIARGDLREAVGCYLRAARLAREGGDHRRFALAALAAAGSGWQSGLDATAEVVSLLAEAVELVPVGPTAIRSRLLARLAVAQSHHGSLSECESTARAALAIARALDDDELEAGALYALAVVLDDPMRRAEQRAAAAELLRRSSGDGDGSWRRLALPLIARIAAADGDMGAAMRALAQLGEEAEASGDRGGQHAATFAGMLDASIRGDWGAARSAAEAVRAAGERVLVDPGAARLAHMGMLAIIDLYEGRPLPAVPDALEWPRPSMAWSVLAGRADGLARAGDVATARIVLADRDPDELGVLERDGYWLPTLAMLADAAHLSDCPSVADTVGALLAPLITSTIVDPGLIYRGSAAHAAGLAAATCQRHAVATELLSEAVQVHDAHGSPWMSARSSQVLASLPSRSPRRGVLR
jgi:DNA-binding SARP family transcriptional activator